MHPASFTIDMVPNPARRSTLFLTPPAELLILQGEGEWRAVNPLYSIQVSVPSRDVEPPIEALRARACGAIIEVWNTLATKPPEEARYLGTWQVDLVKTYKEHVIEAR